MAEEFDRKVSFSLVAKMEGYLANIAHAQQATEKSMAAIEGSFNSVGSGIHKVVGAVGTLTGILAGGAAFKGIISETTNWIGAIGKLARDLGISAEQASALKVAAHGLGIDTDLVTSAALRLAKSINSDGGAAIERLGVSVRDSNGHLRSSIDIMADVNSALAHTKAGTDRNAMGLAVYSRSWGEVQATLRLTREEMERGRKTAEEFHLVFSSQNVAEVREYKRQINELKLVGESLEIQIGIKMLPTLRDLGLFFNKYGPEAAHIFGDSLKGVTRIAAESGVVIGATYDKWKNWNDTGGLLGHVLSKDKEAQYEKRKKEIEDGANAQMLEIYDGLYGHHEVKGPSGSDALGKPAKEAKSKAEKKNYTEDSPGFMNWRRRQADEQEELAWLAERNKELERAQQELQKIMAEMDLDEIENGLKKSDAWLNYMGKLSDTQQARVDEVSMLSTWEGKRQQADRDAQKAGRDYMRGSSYGDGKTIEMEKLDQERDAAIQTWAMMTDSFEENQRRMTVIEQIYSEKRKKLKADEEQAKLQIVATRAGQVGDTMLQLHNLLGKQDKVAFRAFQAARAVETAVTGYSAAAKAWDIGLKETGSYYGAAAYAAGSALFTGVQLAGVLAANADGSGAGAGGAAGNPVAPGGSYNPVVTQPQYTLQTQQQGSMTIIFQGNVMDQAYIEEKVVPMMNDAGTRDIKVQYMN